MALPKVKIGVLLPTRGLLVGPTAPSNADGVIKLAQQAESSGLDSVWVGDSLTAKPRLEPLATLAAVAARTEVVRLGTAVLLAGLRHPVLLAQMAATIDLISRGRLVLGVGVGGAFNDEQRREWQAAGVVPEQRARRLEEVIQVLRELGTGREVSFAGRHFNLKGVAMEPRPVQPGGVPLLLACHWRARKETQIQRAARLADGVISISDSPEEYAQLVQRIKSAAAGLGRDLTRFESAFYLTVNVSRDVAKGEAEAKHFLMKYYGADVWGTRWGPFGDPERVKSRMMEYAEAGARTLVVRFASFEVERQLDVFLSRVAPAFLE